MNALNLSVILITVFMSAVAQLLLKMGVIRLTTHQGIFDGGLSSLIVAFTSPLIFTGMVIYAASAISWLWVLSKVDLSIAYPFVGLSFVITMLFGAFLLSEPVNFSRVSGTLMIAVGCFFIARS